MQCVVLWTWRVLIWRDAIQAYGAVAFLHAFSDREDEMHMIDMISRVQFFMFGFRKQIGLKVARRNRIRDVDVYSL